MTESTCLVVLLGQLATSMALAESGGINIYGDSRSKWQAAEKSKANASYERSLNRRPSQPTTSKKPADSTYSGRPSLEQREEADRISYYQEKSKNSAAKLPPARIMPALPSSPAVVPSVNRTPPAVSAPEDNVFGLDCRALALPIYEDRDRSQVITALSNYFFNQQSNHSAICQLDWKTWHEGGLVSISTFMEAGTQKSLSLATCFPKAAREIYTDYPYSCQSGQRMAASYQRLDWLAYRLLIQKNYHKLDSVPENQSDYVKELGSEMKFTNRQILRKIIADSTVARDVRGIGLLIDGSKKVRAIDTFDFNVELKKGAESLYSKNPNNVLVDAAEVFIIKPNQLWKYALLDIVNDKRLDAAPAGVADFQEGLSVSDSYPSVNAHRNYASIRNGVDCLICHMGGTLSRGIPSINREIFRDALALGSLSAPKDIDLARILYNIPKGTENIADYDPADEVDRLLNKQQESFATALKNMGVLVGGNAVPVLPDASAVYLDDVTFPKMSEELFVSVSEFQQALSRSSQLRTLVGLKDAQDANTLRLARVIFEDRYCKILQALQGAHFTKPAQFANIAPQVQPAKVAATRPSPPVIIAANAKPASQPIKPPPPPAGYPVTKTANGTTVTWIQQVFFPSHWNALSKTEQDAWLVTTLENSKAQR